MPRQEGVKFTCNRCGAAEFIPYKPLSSKYGHDADDNKWTRIDEDIWLCPSCGQTYKDLMSEFIHIRDPKYIL